jgi:hypothetical protein
VARADLLRAIHSWATRRGLMLVLSGIDLNPRSAIEAVAATPTGTVIAWETGDVFDQAPEPKPDFVVSSQFAHHLTDDQVVAFLLWLEQQPTRLVHRRPALPHAAILRLSPPLPRRGLASHRAPGRHGLDRPRLPASPGICCSASASAGRNDTPRRDRRRRARRGRRAQDLRRIRYHRATPASSAPGLGSRFGSKTPNVRSNLN